ncbi:zinc finger protein 414 [Scomber scombrus]|uniref:zinc finger protein 414 n=1 Tax=Scomber scombrus TaxID=13677 RepID=UPI002DDB5E9C|nr:zinc finger protein 414 [Scomber scombrus]
MSSAVQTAEHGHGGNQRIPCPLYGCKRVYSDMSSLDTHIKDHEMPAQSLPGKVLLCSTVGCSGSFPNMQKLMEHMRHHHKPNIFFLCESCRTKLRSYRGLLTHLHTCSKVTRGKAKSEATNSQSANVNPMASTDLNPAQLDAVSAQHQQPPQIPQTDGSFPAAFPQPDSAAPPSLFNPDATSPQLTEAAPPQPQLDRSTAAHGPPVTHAQHHPGPQTRTPESLHPALAPASAPQSPPGSAATWKKNQGMACNRRILWEHTKGRYTCVQCGHTATNRKDMTQHISTQHSSNKPAEDTRSPVTNT